MGSWPQSKMKAMGGVTLAGRWTSLVQNTFPTLVLSEHKNALLDLLIYMYVQLCSTPTEISIMYVCTGIETIQDSSSILPHH